MIEPLPSRPPRPLNSGAAAVAAVAVTDCVICDELVQATRKKLRMIADSWFIAAPELQMHETARRVRAGILECAVNLERLQTLHTPVEEHTRLEIELLEARAALAQARAELVGTQADEKSARHLSLHDSLTSLPNRGYFRQELEQAVLRVQRSNGSLAVFYLDLDVFKPLNDLHGHDAGDQILRIVGARLARVVRAEDMVSRMGGDEFACLLLGLQQREQLRLLAAKLHSCVSASIRIGDLELSIRPSIGIAVFPDDGATPDSLLKSADVAMYRAKRQRTGHAFFADR